MYKKSCAVLGIALAAAVATPLIIVNAEPTASGPAPFKYGLYVHFDISTFAGYRGAKDIGHVPPERYAPTGLDVAGWVRTAKQAGMDCAVLTVKHEAGFCMWDAADYDYDVASSPVKTDVVAEFISACKAEGILPGIHYSIPDAHNEGTVLFKGPVGAEYFEFIKKQTKELHTKYPDIKVQVFDIAFRLSKSQLLELSQTVKELNPSCAVLCELGKPAASKYACDTVNKDWLWSPDAQLAPAQKLYEKYSQTRASELPFLLNVGPDRSGRIPDQYTATLMELKRLIDQNPPQ
jgi:alpha-L-fucosidase